MLTDNQIERYSRNIIVDEIGVQGQQKLMAAKVLVIGVGGLGSVVLQYLAAAGVGTLGIIDHDTVELSNLQRQIIHTTDCIGIQKTESASRFVEALNPDVKLVTYSEKLTVANARSIIKEYDVIADGSDNITTRYLVNDTCYALKKPLISAAVRGVMGQLYTFKAYEENKPCYRCLYPDALDNEANCTRSGVLGSVVGVMGSMQATEILKEIMGVGESLAGKLITYNSLNTRIKTIRLPKDPGCSLCHMEDQLLQIA